ncbi:MAG: hypothetical protein WCK67_09210 [bacterium]
MSVSMLYKLLDKIEAMILHGLPIPITPFVVVDHEKILDTIDKIKASIPGEIQEAQSLLKKSEEIQIEAQRKSRQLIEEAQRHAEMLLSESELLNAVQAEADRIRKQVITDCEQIKKQAIEEAEMIKRSSIEEAIHIREGADKYAESALANLDRDLADLHAIVKNGQKHLAKTRAESLSSIAAHVNKSQFAEKNKI